MGFNTVEKPSGFFQQKAHSLLRAYFLRRAQKFHTGSLSGKLCEAFIYAV